MNKQVNILSLLLILCFIACTDDAEVQVQDSVSISLPARVEPYINIGGPTRVSNVDDTAYRGVNPKDNPFHAKICFSFTDGIYANSPQAPTYLPIHTNIFFNQNTPVFPDKYYGNDLKYPTDDRDIYTVAFYPQDTEGNTWNISETDHKTATHVINGSQDLMYAPQIKGNRIYPFPSQTFHHLLTWLRFCVRATTAEAINNWGPVEYIRIKTLTQANIDLSKPLVNLNDNERNAVTYSDNDNDETNNLIDIYVDTDSEPMPDDKKVTLTTTFAQAGSVMCAPSTTYTLYIKTKNYPEEKTINITLNDINNNPINDTESTRGKLFVVELEFHPFNVVESVCVLNDWEAQDEDLFNDNQE